jgi:hypothetical protein
VGRSNLKIAARWETGHLIKLPEGIQQRDPGGAQPLEILFGCGKRKLNISSTVLNQANATAILIAIDGGIGAIQGHTSSISREKSCFVQDSSIGPALSGK